MICYSQASNLAKPGFLHIYIYMYIYTDMCFLLLKYLIKAMYRFFSYINEGARKEAKHEDYKFLSFVIFLCLTKEVNKQTITVIKPSTIFLDVTCYTLCVVMYSNCCCYSHTYDFQNTDSTVL